MTDANDRITDLESRLADALDDLAQRDRQMEVIENFIVGLEKDYSQVAQSAAEVEVLRSKVLDLEDQLTRTESANEVMENFCFGLEMDHARAREVAERLEADREEIFATIDQGLFTIAPDGSINEGWSHATERMLGANLAGRSLEEIFAAEHRDAIERYVTLLFSPRARDRMLQRLCPIANIWHSTDGGNPRLLACRVTRIRDAGGDVVKALIEVRDRTQQHRVETELEERTKVHTARVERLYSILTLPLGAFDDFASDAGEVLDLVVRSARPDVSGELLGRVHALKGAGLALGLDRVVVLCHRLEDALATGPDERWSERVQEAVCELREEICEGADLMTRAHRIAGDRVSRTPMADRLHASLARVVSHETRQTRKRVAMHCEIGELEHLRREHLHSLSTALVQGVRNAIAHGVEPPTERVAAGKLPCGTIAVEVQVDTTRLVATCSDDGRGIDASALIARARRLGVSVPAETDVLDLVFHGGLSTADAVSAHAGRGVGMNVIRAAMVGFGGTASIRSEPGRGVQLRLELPLDQSRRLRPTTECNA